MALHAVGKTETGLIGITVMEAMVGCSEDGLVDSVVDEGLVDGVVDNWCWLWHWDDTAAHLAWKLHRDLPGEHSSDLRSKSLLTNYPIFWICVHDNEVDDDETLC